MQCFAFLIASACINVILSVTALEPSLERQPAARDLQQLVNNLRTDPNGLFHIGNDGILRSYDKDNKVIDYARLDSAELKSLAKRYSKDEENLIALWENADSSMIDEAEIWSPEPLKNFLSLDMLTVALKIQIVTIVFMME
ncbi:hypothetical protein I7I51_02582 [Histoplasma capsulatum]|uniref:Uncharacterized protein n=1 Tax=Ajellomyces capsulatus TaxID=5037 RepID=A0A8A1MA68_AJECA|nr:predicted protein [Histoplasma mississippiense (nom. inval.)]EDN04341.1 predicted protein [Histoplasma mississippiense (nom. inval.)]QSS62839.1 hypothetical protein I7I51_02582 [Histoplasma capsulatum]